MSDILLFCVKKYLCFRRLDKSKKNRQYIEKDNDRRKGSKSGMILAIDMGNTNIVIGCIDDEKIYFEERIATDLSKTELEYFCLFKTVLELYQIHGDEINGAIISSVVPPLVNVLKDAVEKLIGVTPYIVGSGIRTGLNIVMDNPRQVGSDMIVDAVAAVREYKAPFIVIDIGTATTMSVVDRHGNYIGGCIMPGVKVSADSLAAKAAQLSKVDFAAPAKCIGIQGRADWHDKIGGKGTGIKKYYGKRSSTWVHRNRHDGCTAGFRKRTASGTDTDEETGTDGRYRKCGMLPGR